MSGAEITARRDWIAGNCADEFLAVLKLIRLVRYNFMAAIQISLSLLMATGHGQCHISK